MYVPTVLQFGPPNFRRKRLNWMVTLKGSSYFVCKLCSLDVTFWHITCSLLSRHSTGRLLPAHLRFVRTTRWGESLLIWGLLELFNIPQASLEGVTTSHELTELLVKRFPGKAKEVLYSPLDKCGCKDLAMQLMEQGAGIHRLCLVPPVLSLGTPEKSLAPLSLLPPFGYSYTSRRSPLSLLFCSLNNPSSLSLSSYDVLKNSGLKLSRINHLA
ncbi:uncharacterized protein LOC112973088 isoform X2 [Apteryx rowi]|uniref:uncharacterized protein LOC112973088 isoform X2 n=1 Tax=Apteryx rowi TaxID=308060 RepID=UPI000E1C6887|nr:uncharacterized protein LOC112973088 isoform X2 [Apteryx rowi]